MGSMIAGVAYVLGLLIILSPPEWLSRKLGRDNTKQFQFYKHVTGLIIFAGGTISIQQQIQSSPEGSVSQGQFFVVWSTVTILCIAVIKVWLNYR